MTPDTLISLTERNSRNVELMMRTAEKDLADLAGQHLALEQDILTHLGNIATLHLEQGNTGDAEVSTALQRRQQAQDQLRAQLQTAEQHVARTLADKDSLQARVDRIDQQARESLEQDAEYARNVEQLDQTQAAHREQVTGYEDLRQECAQKRPTFDANPIYCYLRSHAFGTEAYRRNRLHLAMDQWLAKKVDYSSNRRNELSLIAMGERNEAMQLERETLIQALSAGIDVQIAQARERLGFKSLGNETAACLAAVEEAKGRANTLQQQLAAFAQNQDPHYQRARELLTKRLKTRSIGQLVDLASQTPDEADDLIVEQLQSLHLQLKSVEAETAELQQNQQSLQTRYERAKSLQRKLRNDAFTGSDIYFDLSTDFERLLANYMDGDVTLGRVIDVLNQGRTLVRRSQAATQRAFVSSTTTSFSFSTTNVSGSGQSTRSSNSGEFRTTDSF